MLFAGPWQLRVLLVILAAPDLPATFGHILLEQQRVMALRICMLAAPQQGTERQEPNDLI